MIHWNPDLVMLHLGPVELRWYSMCWLVGLLGAYLLARWLYRKEGLKDEIFDPLFIYCFVGILIGARLGHCIFYEPDYFLTSPKGVLEMIVPIRQMTDGSWRFTGYQGLASHGGTIGLIAGVWLYGRSVGLRLIHVLDYIGIVTPITAGFIRLGNLMNSEIIGKPTDVPWAFIFERVDMQPRHPGQLYEAIAYFLLLFIGLWLYHKSHEQHKAQPVLSKPRVPKTGHGFFFGLCIAYIFTFRFFIEYTKENQEAFEDGMIFNMGQLLSVPFILLGAFYIWHAYRKEQ